MATLPINPATVSRTFDLSEQLAPTQKTKIPLSTSSSLSKPTAPPTVGNTKTDIFTQDKKAQFQKAISEKNPLALPTFEEQGASVQAKLLRIYKNPEYGKLSPEGRVKVRSEIYDKYVVPSYKAHGLQAPDKKTWLIGTKSSNAAMIQPEEYFRSPSLQAAHDMVTGAVHQAQGIVAFGLRMTNAQLMASTGVANLLGSHLPFIGDYVHDNIEANKATAQKMIKRLSNSVQDGLQSTDFLLQSHPREGFLASAPAWTGEQVVQLPFYVAVSAGMEAIGLRNLSTKLASSKIGQFVGSRLYSAANMFVSSIVTGSSAKEATEGAAGVAAGETALAPIGVASNSFIKKWTSNVIVMGGKPLAEELSKSAISDSAFGRLEDGLLRTTAFNGRVTEVREAVEKGFKPGYFEHQGQRYEYKTAQERMEVYDTLEQRIKEHREAEDPVLHKMMTAEQMSLDAIALRHFNKPLKTMSQDELIQVFNRRTELIDEATYELPAHVPDLNKMTVSEENAKESVESPIFGQFAAQMKAAGFPDIDEVVNSEQVQSIEKQTGITSSKGAVAKIEKVKTTGKKSGKLDADAFASHRVDTLQYFKNPTGGKERLAADGTKIGGRDKRSWAERLKAENTAQFVETLKEADGDKIKFENPYHRMLFHWSNRDNLPQPVRDKLLREMKKVVETGAHPRYNMTAKQFNLEADWALQHLQLLAQSGRLGTEKNIFASSKFGGPENWTPWQAELQTEVDKQELSTLKTLVERHPEAKKSLTSTLKKIQAQRFNAENPEEWFKYNAAINQYLKLGIF